MDVGGLGERAVCSFEALCVEVEGVPIGHKRWTELCSSRFWWCWIGQGVLFELLHDTSIHHIGS